VAYTSQKCRPSYNLSPTVLMHGMCVDMGMGVCGERRRQRQGDRESEQRTKREKGMWQRLILSWFR